ncbi:MAG: hypothetical protein ACRD22_03685 [Terriglobia bacterium]
MGLYQPARDEHVVSSRALPSQGNRPSPASLINGDFQLEVVDGFDGLGGIVAVPAHQLAHARPVLLLDVRVIVFLVRPAAGKLGIVADTISPAAWLAAANCSASESRACGGSRNWRKTSPECVASQPGWLAGSGDKFSENNLFSKIDSLRYPYP